MLWLQATISKRAGLCHHGTERTGTNRCELMQDGAFGNLIKFLPEEALPSPTRTIKCWISSRTLRQDARKG